MLAAARGAHTTLAHDARPALPSGAPPANGVIGWRVVGTTAARPPRGEPGAVAGIVFDGDDRDEANDGWGEVHAHAATARAAKIGREARQRFRGGAGNRSGEGRREAL